MLLRRRGILIGIGILALATVSLAATVQLYFFQLPEPEEADTRGIIRWMVIRDLSEESPELRRRLLRQIDKVFGERKLSSESGYINDHLDPKYRPRFWSNVDVLVREWFYVQSDKYAAATPAEQTAMLDKILDEAQSLSKFQADAPAANSPESSSSAPVAEEKTDPITAAAKFIEKMKGWIEEAPPVDQQRVRHFAAALQARMAVRSLQGFMKAFNGDRPATRP